MSSLAEGSQMGKGAATISAQSGIRPTHFKLRHRLLALAAVAILPAFVIVVANHIVARNLRSAELDSYAIEVTETVRNEVVRGMSAAATLMLATGRAAVVLGHDQARCEDYAASLRRDLPTVIDIAIADMSGDIYCHSGVSELPAMEASMRNLVEADQPGLVVGGYTSTPGGPTLPIGMVLRDASQTVQGAIQLHVNMAELVRLVTEATRSLPQSLSIVTDRDGFVLLSLPEDKFAAGTELPAPYAQLLESPEIGATRLVSPEGTVEIVGYRPALESLPIAAIFAMPEAPVMAPIDRAAITNSLIAMAGAVLALALAWFIGITFIQRPVDVVHKTLQARQTGDELARTGLNRDNSELGLIAHSVDTLFDELDRRALQQRHAEEQRDLFAREVQHRVKNLLAIVQVIARHSLRRADAPPEVLAFEKRIDAIVRTNSRLLNESYDTADLEEIIHETIAPFVDPQSDRITLEGPKIRLRAKVISAMAMAVHELATNAVKYGALSNDAGRVDIRWTIDNNMFAFDWTEMNGPAVKKPTTSGFGTLLVSRVLRAETRGEVSSDFAEGGYHLRLTAPLQDLVPWTEGAIQNP
jgi:two-component sensor histidine kinase